MAKFSGKSTKRKQGYCYSLYTHHKLIKYKSVALGFENMEKSSVHLLK